MAVVGEILVPRASKAEADVFDESIDSAMMQMGGPPAGLMVHFALWQRIPACRWSQSMTRAASWVMFCSRTTCWAHPSD